MEMQHAPFQSPGLFLLFLLLLGFGVLFASVIRSAARRSLYPWVAIAMGCSAVALAMLVLVGYRSQSTPPAVMTHLAGAEAAPFSATRDASLDQRISAISGHNAGPSIESASHQNASGNSAAPVQGFRWFAVLGISWFAMLLISGVLLLVFFFSSAGVLTGWAFGRPATAGAGAGSTSTAARTCGWLVVPVICLALLGALAQPALLPSADRELVRKSVAFGQQQEHTNKVWLDLMKSSAMPDAEIKNIPDWLQDRSLSSHQFLLSSGQYSTPQEAENELLPHAAFLLQRAFQESHPWQGPWVVPLTQVRERVVDKQFIEKRSKTIGKFTGDIYRLHMRVDVSPAVCEAFTASWKSQIVAHRLQVLGVLFAWLVGVFFAASIYFRRAAHPENFVGWWGQFKISAVTIGMAAAAAWVLVDIVR